MQTSLMFLNQQSELLELIMGKWIFLQQQNFHTHYVENGFITLCFD